MKLYGAAAGRLPQETEVKVHQTDGVTKGSIQ